MRSAKIPSTQGAGTGATLDPHVCHGVRLRPTTDPEKARDDNPGIAADLGGIGHESAAGRVRVTH
jgi:hypothetical protein